MFFCRNFGIGNESIVNITKSFTLRNTHYEVCAVQFLKSGTKASRYIRWTDANVRSCDAYTLRVSTSRASGTACSTSWTERKFGFSSWSLFFALGHMCSIGLHLLLLHNQAYAYGPDIHKTPDESAIEVVKFWTVEHVRDKLTNWAPTLPSISPHRTNIAPVNREKHNGTAHIISLFLFFASAERHGAYRCVRL